MPQTPDRRPGALLEPDEILLGGDATGDPSTLGAIRYVSGNFRMKDSVGVFNPRNVDGHVIYEETGVLAQRSKLRFFGSAITAADNAGEDATDVTLTDGGVTAEENEYLPIPEGIYSGDSANAIAATLCGGSYVSRRVLVFNRIIFRITTWSGTSTLTIQIFQQANGLSGVATRVATVSNYNPGGAGTFVVAPSEGTIRIVPGRFFILYGRWSGTAAPQFRSYKLPAVDLLNRNVDIGTHPVAFTTAIAASTTPATVDPRQTPTGQFTGTIADVVGVFRFKTV